MTHDTAIDLVVDSLVEPLDADRARDLDQHLAACAACAGEAAELRALWGDLGSLPMPAPDAAAAVRLGKRLATRRPAPWAPAVRAAAVVMLVGTGFVAGRLLPRGEVGERGEGPPPPEITTLADAGAFLFLLRGTAPDREASPEVLFEEYSMWARELDGAGRLLGGEKLTDDPGLWLGKETPGVEMISGFFLVRAADYGEAEEIALSSPHLAYGGVIEVRAVDR